MPLLDKTFIPWPRLRSATGCRLEPKLTIINLEQSERHLFNLNYDITVFPRIKGEVPVLFHLRHIYYEFFPKIRARMCLSIYVCVAEQSCIQFSLLLECWCSVVYFISFIFYYISNYSDSRSRSHTQICIHVCVYTCVFAEKSHTIESQLVLFIASFIYFILFVFYMLLLIGCSVSSYRFIYFILIVCRIILFILIG